MKADSLIRRHVRNILMEGKGELIPQKILTFMVNMVKRGEAEVDHQSGSDIRGNAPKWKNINSSPGDIVNISFYGIPEKKISNLHDWLKKDFGEMYTKDWGTSSGFLKEFITSFKFYLAKNAPSGIAGTYYGRPEVGSSGKGKIADNFFFGKIQDPHGWEGESGLAKAAVFINNDQTLVHEFSHGVQSVLGGLPPRSKEYKKDDAAKRPAEKTESIDLILKMKLPAGIEKLVLFFSKIIGNDAELIKSKHGGWVLLTDWKQPREVTQKVLKPAILNYFKENGGKKETSTAYSYGGPANQPWLIDPDKFPSLPKRLLQNFVRWGSSEEDGNLNLVPSRFFDAIPLKMLGDAYYSDHETIKQLLEDSYFTRVFLISPKKVGNWRKSEIPALDNQNTSPRRPRKIPKTSTTTRKRSSLHSKKYNKEKGRGANEADVWWNLHHWASDAKPNTGDKWKRQPSEFDADFRSKFRLLINGMIKHGISKEKMGLQKYYKFLGFMINDDIEGMAEILVKVSGVLNKFQPSRWNAEKYSTDVLNNPLWDYKKKAKKRFRYLAEAILDIFNNDSKINKVLDEWPDLDEKIDAKKRIAQVHFDINPENASLEELESKGLVALFFGSSVGLNLKKAFSAAIKRELSSLIT